MDVNETENFPILPLQPKASRFINYILYYKLQHCKHLNSTEKLVISFFVVFYQMDDMCL